MDITETFLPVAKELIDQVFPTTVAYLRNEGGSYDPATGEVTQNTTQYDINAGVLSRGRTEEGGVGETQELRLWIHHGTGGMPSPADHQRSGGVQRPGCGRWSRSTPRTRPRG